jgi:hypothetical protein
MMAADDDAAERVAMAANVVLVAVSDRSISGIAHAPAGGTPDKIESIFQLRPGQLRLRGPCRAQDEFSMQPPSEPTTPCNDYRQATTSGRSMCSVMLQM